ncbi:hypothetical protein HVV49_12390 [Citrobacter freundii]|nr:hypothetical protein [Citrobacter freundii]
MRTQGNKCHTFSIYFIDIYGGNGKLEFNMSGNNKHIKIIDIFWGGSISLNFDVEKDFITLSSRNLKVAAQTVTWVMSGRRCGVFYKSRPQEA